jgi:hypothetical protein
LAGAARFSPLRGHFGDPLTCCEPRFGPALCDATPGALADLQLLPPEAALYFPAISAMRFNPTLRPFANRLRERNESNLTIIAAVMRKLLTLAYGVLKSSQAFDPSYGAS